MEKAQEQITHMTQSQKASELVASAGIGSENMPKISGFIARFFEKHLDPQIANFTSCNWDSASLFPWAKDWRFHF